MLTQEGICGNEEFPDATHNVTLPFTRMINGAADYTICYFDKRIKTTHAHQLAASLVYYSPLQTIFWYDKPSFYNDEPEMEWFENLPTVFDDSKVLDGGGKVKTRTQVKCTYLIVNSSQTLVFRLKPSGGAAIRLVPIDGKEMKKYKKYREQIL